jgi:hypothetical protein
MHEASGQIYEEKKLTESDKKRLVAISGNDEDAVQSMNRSQRRAWGTTIRQTGNRKLAYQVAQKKGWQGTMPEPERIRGETKDVAMLDQKTFGAARRGEGPGQ